MHLVRRFGFVAALILAAASLGAPTPAASAPTASTDWGGCSWYCGSVRYASYSACNAACGTDCEPLCW
ncbi:MAG: hypothetical protein R3F59_15045 [Myxococcota bacterium]